MCICKWEEKDEVSQSLSDLAVQNERVRKHYFIIAVQAFAFNDSFTSDALTSE